MEIAAIVILLIVCIGLFAYIQIIEGWTKELEGKYQRLESKFDTDIDFATASLQALNDLDTAKSKRILELESKIEEIDAKYLSMMFNVNQAVSALNNSTSNIQDAVKANIELIKLMKAELESIRGVLLEPSYNKEYVRYDNSPNAVIGVNIVK